MQSLQLSLVTASGLLLASKPESADDTQQILATSLISAIITFAKEVHRQELQSISYHDKNISFAEVHDFIFIMETKVEETFFSDRQLAQILEQIQLSASPMLEGRDETLISEGEAELILEHVLHNIFNLPLFFSKNPLRESEPFVFSLIHFDETDTEIIESVGKKEETIETLNMIIQHRLTYDFDKKLTGMLLFVPQKKTSELVIIEKAEMRTNVGILKFKPDLDHTVFRLFPLIEEKLRILTDQDYNFEMLDILDIIQNMEDPGNHFTHTDVEELSLAFLSTAIPRQISDVLYSVISGRKVLLAGDKLTVKLAIDTLSMFNQHLAVKVQSWITIQEDAISALTELDTSLCGMNIGTFNQLDLSKAEYKDLMKINLLEGTVKGQQQSEYFFGLFEKSVNEDITKTAIKIFNELRKLVSMSYIITSFSLYSKEQAEPLFGNLFEHSGFPSSFVDKAIELAIKRNPLLLKLI
ncbi:MAG: hypothetical protein GOP50_03375 [Candidatus Heimdallarchaeota archaeon]|nr:hypothetical protein [Candidatus Heimdallarchaeota archaeon]